MDWPLTDLGTNILEVNFHGNIKTSDYAEDFGGGASVIHKGSVGLIYNEVLKEEHVEEKFAKETVRRNANLSSKKRLNFPSYKFFILL